MEPCIVSTKVFRVRTIRKFAFLVFFITVYNSSFSQAKKGVLDLRSWNWANDGITDLNGEWEFYWQSLYTPYSFDSAKIEPSVYSNVPEFWNSQIPGNTFSKPGFGYATYKLKVLCPSSNEKLDLKFLTIGSAYKLFVNGKQILHLGIVGTSEATSLAAFIPKIVPVIPENSELNIIIQVSNFTYNEGGIWDFIKLGPTEKIHTFWLRNVSWDFFIAGSFFMIGIFYFVIYFFSEEDYRLYILVCFACCLRCDLW